MSARHFFGCIALAAIQRPRVDAYSVNLLMWIVQMCEQEPADLSTRKHRFMFALRAVVNHHLREFVKTHVILAPLREFSRSRAASKIPFPGAQPGKPGWPGEPDFFSF